MSLLSRVVLRCGAQNANAVRSSLAAKQLKNSGLISRRLLMSSLETGGISLPKTRRRVQPIVKLMSAGGILFCALPLYYSFASEDQINKFLGTDWNTAAVATAFLAPTITILVYLIMSPTIPF